jgi:predicted acyltransferase
VRLLGVLQRIAICYFFASVIIYYFKRNGAIIAALLLLLAYWAICYFGNPDDPFSLTGWIGTSIDQIILGKEHMYFSELMNLNDTVNTNAWPKTIEEVGFNKDIITKPAGKNIAVLFDPEGILSTISAIAQVIFGYVIGKFILDNGSNRKTVEKLLIIGLILGIIGTVWHQFFPVNKKIWSSSYTVLTTGMATLFLAIFIYLFEILKVPQIFGKFFDAFGKNPLFIFVLSGALPRLVGLFRVHSVSPFNNPEMKSRLTSPFTWFYENVCFKLSSSFMLTSFIYAILMILFYWLIAYVMDKRKIYVKV